MNDTTNRPIGPTALGTTSLFLVRISPVRVSGRRVP